MNSLKTGIVLCIFFSLCFPFESEGRTITEDTVWSGEVILEDDILVPEGISLTVLPGTTINIIPSDRTKTDPEYLSSMTEITVRGRLKVEGKFGSSVLFHVWGENGPDRWAGIIVDGGSVHISRTTIQNAEAGIYVLKGIVRIKDSVISGNRYGLIVFSEGSDVNMESVRIIKNEFGVFEINNPRVKYNQSVVKRNIKKDFYIYGDLKREEMKNELRKPAYQRSNESCRRPDPGTEKDYTVKTVETTKQYGDEVLLGDTIWRGRIEISGLIRVPEKVRLIITPGTIVEFRKRDTNGDGIGENGILMQGILIAKGSEENPIIFRSAEKYRGMGDWDAINIMNSDGVQNLVEYVQIENAYRGLHFHFSNVAVNGSVLKDNYRAIQFQESSVEMRNNYIFSNKSGIKARDSEIVFKKNRIFNNINGVNFFRTSLTAEENEIRNNINNGMRIREGMTTVQNNLFDCNRFGLRINSSYFGKFNENVVSNSFETGVSLRESDNVDLSENFIQGSGFNGINVLASGASIKGNHISGNGERGIGIQSFTGRITGNSIIKNGLYAIDNESPSDISAPLNWFGESDAAQVLYDKEDSSGRGRIRYSLLYQAPATFVWPVKNIRADITWYDSINLENNVSVLDGATLVLSPGTSVIFSKGIGMKISESRILAAGEDEKRITFTSMEKGEDNRWGEILLEHADGSIFSYCDFEYASWAVHSHFTNLKVLHSRFRNNDGGMRFRSGPMEITGSQFTENRIGMRAFRANALIKGNEFFNNETGIFIRERGGGLTIRKNNFHSNSSYHIRVGDFNVEDVDARENWWGGIDPVEMIFDGRREPGVGKVIFEPVLGEKATFKE